MSENSIPIEVKSLTDQGEFTGIASTSGNVDLGGDIMQPGAFTKTIAERGNKVRLMDNHKIRIGMATVSEVPEGLQANGKINLDKQSGRDAFSDLKFYRDHGLPMGMSIGYQAVKSDYDQKGNRLLKEVKLFEVTVTELPMNENAQVLTVKSFNGLLDGISAEINELKESGVTEDSKRRATRLMSQLEAIINPQTKSGRMISAANKETISAALDKMQGAMDQHKSGMEQCKSAMDDFQALIDDEAEEDDPNLEDDGITSKSKAAKEVKAIPEPVVDHSELEGMLARLSALTQ